MTQHSGAENLKFYQGIHAGYENYYFIRPPMTVAEGNYAFRSNLFVELPLAEDTRLILSGLYSPFTHGPLFELILTESFFSYGFGVKQRLGPDWLCYGRHQRWLIINNVSPGTLRREVIYYEAALAQVAAPWQWGLKASWMQYFNGPGGISATQTFYWGPLVAYEQPLLGPFYFSVELSWMWAAGPHTYFSVSVPF